MQATTHIALQANPLAKYRKQSDLETCRIHFAFTSGVRLLTHFIVSHFKQYYKEFSDHFAA